MPQRVNDGGKLTGQMGRQDVGFMHVSTGEEEDSGSSARSSPLHA